MNAHYRRQLNRFQYLFHRGACLEGILYMAPHPGSIQMGGCCIDRDQDQLLVFLLQWSLRLRQAAKCQVGFEEVWIKFPELFPQRIPVAFRLVGLGVRICLLYTSDAADDSVYV